MSAQVLAEQARRYFSAQFVRPPLGILVGVGVYGLVLAAVTAASLPVSCHSQPGHIDRPVHRPLVDRGAVEVAIAYPIHDVQGTDLGNAHSPMFPRRHRRGLIDPALYHGVGPSRRPIAWTIYRDSRMLEDSRHTTAKGGAHRGV